MESESESERQDRDRSAGKVGGDDEIFDDLEDDELVIDGEDDRAATVEGAGGGSVLAEEDPGETTSGAVPTRAGAGFESEPGVYVRVPSRPRRGNYDDDDDDDDSGEGGAAAPPRRAAPSATSSATRGASRARGGAPPTHGIDEEDWESAEPTEPCRHPADEQIFLEFGQADAREHCWACEHATDGDPAVNGERLAELTNLVRNNIGFMPLHALTREVSAYFERYIRGPINANLAPGERPVREWRPATILEHFRDHIKEPSMMLVARLEQVRQMISTVGEHQLYRRQSAGAAAAAAAAVPAAPGSLAVDPDAAKLLMELWRHELRLYSAKPQGMFLHNPNIEVLGTAAGGGGVVNAHRRIYRATAPPRRNVGGE